MARIRSIHPEFWRSEDIAALDWDTRLLFIGLWCYVDDNGVGRDVEKLIAAELFPLEDNPRETLAKVSRGLQTLSDGGQIVRYNVGGKPFLFIVAWDKWQKIDRPAKARYERPTLPLTCGNVNPRDTLATPSRQSREGASTGEGEKGRRGEGEKKTTTPSTAVEVARIPGAFDAFWNAYPRKVGKADAKNAFDRKSRSVPASTIIEAATRFARDPNLPETQFIPHPATWLRRGGWEDEPLPPRANGRQAETDDLFSRAAARATERERSAG